MKQPLSLPIVMSKDKVLKRLGDLPKVTQPASGRAGTQTQTCAFSSTMPFVLASTQNIWA